LSLDNMLATFKYRNKDMIFLVNANEKMKPQLNKAKDALK